MTERIYRDPVHNIIRLSADNGEGRLMMRLIDTPEFQRLRRIKQLGLGLYTYQGAEHSRFTHSLGAFHLMTRVLDRLGEKHEIGADDRTAARAAALLHDVGHGSFSHVMEKVLGFQHESWTVKVVLSEETEIGRLLASYSAELPADVAAIIEGKFQPAALAQLVSSQLDVDRMDYLLRDSLMTGAKYGLYDLEWIINALQIDEAGDRIYVAARGIFAVEEYLQARYYMFRQVYFHRTLRSAEAVLNSALSRARLLIERGNLAFRMPGSVFEKMLTGEQVNAGEYLQLDDTDVMFRLKEWSRDDDEILADLATRLMHRRLFKAIDLGADMSERFWETAGEIVRGGAFDPRYYLITDRAADIPYYSDYSPVGVDPKSLIYVEAGPQSSIREISEVSEVVRGMRGYRIDRVCVPVEVADQISLLISDHARQAGSGTQVSPS